MIRKNSILIPILLILIQIGHSQCHYTIDMQDSFGDGWNGASVDVTVNGAPATSFGFTNGFSSSDSLFTLAGDIVEFNFVSGNWDTEISFQIYDPLGDTILDVLPFANNDVDIPSMFDNEKHSFCYSTIHVKNYLKRLQKLCCNYYLLAELSQL